jgi:hypothetical protein
MMSTTMIATTVTAIAIVVEESEFDLIDQEVGRLSPGLLPLSTKEEEAVVGEDGSRVRASQVRDADPDVKRCRRYGFGGSRAKLRGMLAVLQTASD